MTITTEAFVVYMWEVYLGFAKKVSAPNEPSSIFESVWTSVVGSPTTSPFNTSDI